MKVDKGTISYSSTVSGKYSLSISYKGIELKESPVEIEISPAPTFASNCVTSITDKNRAEVGFVNGFFIQVVFSFFHFLFSSPK